MSFSLILAVIFPVLSVLLFKEFEKRKVELLPAIIFNYLGAIFIGLLLFISPIELVTFYQQDWFLESLVVGVFFILNFYLIGKTAVSHGVSIATFANKISLILPIIFAVFYFGEPLGYIKVTGIALAIVAIVLLTINKKDKTNQSSVLFPLLIFFFTGVMESIIYATQKTLFTSENEISYFAISAFAVSFLIGLGFLIGKPSMFSVKALVGGLLLAVPNTFGLYFFIKALNEVTNSVSRLPIMNIGTLLFALLVGVLFYQESLGFKKITGFVLAGFAIFFLS